MNRENKNIDDILYDSLENFEVATSQELKKRIMKDMFFINLVRYHLIKLIGGFVGTVVISVISIYLYNVSEQSSNVNTQKGVTQIANLTKNTINRITTSTTNLSTNTINNSNSNTSLNTALTKTNEAENNVKTQPVVKKNNSTTINFENKIIAEKEVIRANQNQKINTDIQTNTNSVNQLNTGSKNQLPDPLNDKPENKNKNSVLVQNNMVVTPDDKVIVEKKELADLGSSDNLISNTSGSVDKTVEKINHLILKSFFLPINLTNQEFFNDTLYNFKGEQVILKSKFFAVDAFWSGFMHQSNFSNTNPETQTFSLLRNDAVKPVNGYECFGINFNMNNKHFLIQAGISVAKVTDEFTYASLLLHPRQKFVFTQNNNPYNYVDNGNYFLIDTPGGYWHYTYVSDSMIHVSDSIWQSIIDTNLVSIYDSTLKTVYDTLKNKKLRNTYSYFEIPVMVGYEVSLGNFDFALKGGIITSFLINTSGNNTTYNTGELNSISTYLPFEKVFFSGIISVSVNYNITDHWGVYAEPYYRQSLSGMLQNNNILNQRVNAYGARFGLRYKF